MKDILASGFRPVELPDTGKGFDVFEKIGSHWMLVTAGNEQSFNTMTASWGFMGVMWNSPCAITAVRESRYTKEFLDREEYFTLSFLPGEYRSALAFCGSKSGRDFDKCAETGLVPVSVDGTVAFEQAERIVVCKKVYAQPMAADFFTDKDIVTSQYSSGDYHTAYYGKIVAVYDKI